MPFNSINRRGALFSGAALGLALTSATTAIAQTTKERASGRPADVPGETKSLDALYGEALAAGGNLVVYAGGDTATQQDLTVKAFLAKFPKINLKMVVDYSKYHDVRLDNQFATNSVVPDVIQIQTLQNFDRWKKQGRLLNYKPAGFSNIHTPLKDADGAWMAIGIIGFSFMYDTAAVGSAPPASPKDLVNSEWRGKIASSLPQDDDAVLFLYRSYAQAYGWDWIAKLAAQDMQFARGTHTPALAVRGGQRPIGLGGSGTPTAVAGSTLKWILPDSQPFLAWGQRAAILKAAKNQAAAKLYMGWQVSEERQKASSNGWTVRTDIKPPSGQKQIWEYPNSFLKEFPLFMEDRAEVERWRQTFALYFGEVKGDPSPGWLGLRPGA